MKSCLSLTENEALEYLRSALPEADLTVLTDEMLLNIARHALAVRDRFFWGQTIPEDIFKAFVLFPRVNNETVCFYQAVIFDELKDELHGLSMKEAVLTVNRWCLSKATYQSTDDRTLDALSVIRRGFGRCGEESTLLTCALRSVGIPARQIYVPRWSHCDDNHAWVEAYIDGCWHYLGACEPEPDTDSGWFCAAASKAMLVHTRAYGVCPENERIETVHGNVYEINCLETYADTALLKLYLTESGRPAKGLHVCFEILNYGEFYPLTEKETDADGYLTFLTGIGTLHLHIHDGKRFLEKDIDLNVNTEYHFDFSEALTEDLWSSPTPVSPKERCFSQIPPKETRIQKCFSNKAVTIKFKKKTEEADRKRRVRLSEYLSGAKEAASACLQSDPGFIASDLLPLFETARGNIDEILTFLVRPEFTAEDKLLLLKTLRKKDLVDATAHTLSDALETALCYKALYPKEIWSNYVLCPRVMNESLYPVRGQFRAFFETLSADKDTAAVFRNGMLLCTPEALYRYLFDTITFYAEPYETIAPDFFEVLKNRRCPEDQADILFVIAARALGIAARLSPETGYPEYYDGKTFIPLRKIDAADSSLTLENEAFETFTFATDLSIGKFIDGRFKPLAFSGNLEKERKLPLQAGLYRLIISRRFPDGSVDGKAVYLALDPGCDKRYTVTPVPERETVRLLNLPLPVIRALHENDAVKTDITATLAASPSIIAFTAPDEEPSIHLLNELIDAETSIRAGKVAVVLITESEKELKNEKIRKISQTLPDVRLYHAAEEDDVRALRIAVAKLELRLPLSLGTDRNGLIAAAFSNYNVGTVGTLLKLIL